MRGGDFGSSSVADRFTHLVLVCRECMMRVKVRTILSLQMSREMKRKARRQRTTLFSLETIKLACMATKRYDLIQ